MHIGKEKVTKAFLEEVKKSKKNDGFYYCYKDHFVEEKLNLGAYGYVDLFFYKKRYTDHLGIKEESISVKILTICNSMIGFDEILKSTKVKRGVFKYLRENIGIKDNRIIYYSNIIICPGFKEDGFEMMTSDIKDLSIHQYDFDNEGFQLYHVSDRMRELVPSGKILNMIKKRLL